MSKPPNPLANTFRIVRPAPEKGETGDNYVKRLVKLIPAEVVALYLTFRQVAVKEEWIAAWAVICLILVIAVRTLGTRGGSTERTQTRAVAISSVAFVLWIYGIGDQIIQLPVTEGMISATIGVFTVIAPLLYQGDR